MIGPIVAMRALKTIPEPVSNFIFFLPQYVFPTVWKQTGGMDARAYEWWSLPVWGLLMVAFGYLSRNWRLPFVALASVTVFVAVIVIFQIGILLSPFTFGLDGP